MIEPKEMTGRRYAGLVAPHCILCQKAVCPGDLYYTSKTKNRPLRYFHADCWARVPRYRAARHNGKSQQDLDMFPERFLGGATT